MDFVSAFIRFAVCVCVPSLLCMVSVCAFVCQDAQNGWSIRENQMNMDDLGVRRSMLGWELQKWQLRCFPAILSISSSHLETRILRSSARCVRTTPMSWPTPWSMHAALLRRWIRTPTSARKLLGRDMWTPAISSPGFLDLSGAEVTDLPLAPLGNSKSLVPSMSGRRVHPATQWLQWNRLGCIDTYRFQVILGTVLVTIVNCYQYFFLRWSLSTDNLT